MLSTNPRPAGQRGLSFLATPTVAKKKLMPQIMQPNPMPAIAADDAPYSVYDAKNMVEIMPIRIAAQNANTDKVPNIALRFAVVLPIMRLATEHEISNNVFVRQIKLNQTAITMKNSSVLRFSDNFTPVESVVGLCFTSRSPSSK